jgi:hypothetical protein
MKKEKGMAFRCGQMDQNISDNGKMIRQTVGVRCFTEMETSMKAIGKMIKHMVKANTLKIMDQRMKETGRRTDNMGMGKCI